MRKKRRVKRELPSHVICPFCARRAGHVGDFTDEAMWRCVLCDIQFQVTNPGRISRLPKSSRRATWWTRTGPKTEGYYLRVNAGHGVSLHWVQRFALGVFRGLKIFWGWGGDGGWIPASHPKVQKGPAVAGGDQEGWWWYGPIPKPPEEAR